MRHWKIAFGNTALMYLLFFADVSSLRILLQLEALRHLPVQEGGLPLRPPRDRLLRHFHVFLGSVITFLIETNYDNF